MLALFSVEGGLFPQKHSIDVESASSILRWLAFHCAISTGRFGAARSADGAYCSPLSLSCRTCNFPEGQRPLSLFQARTAIDGNPQQAPRSHQSVKSDGFLVKPPRSRAPSLLRCKDPLALSGHREMSVYLSAFGGEADMDDHVAWTASVVNDPSAT
jgi:hypothetical protein